MAKERDNFKAVTGEESYWTNSAFGGMPTYQLGANYPHNYVKKLDRLIRFLPRPADYLMLYFVGFYILMLCFKADFRLAILGALAYGFSTYFILILDVGHNSKAHALGYIPLVIGGIVLVFRKKYLWGFVLTALGMALEVMANHYQMTYYFMLLIAILGIVYLVYAIKQKELKHYFSSLGILIAAVILGISTNATNLMATKEYADWSIRGDSRLTINADGSPKEITNGLDREYITQYSVGLGESLNIFIPRFYGGSSGEDIGESSKAYEYLVNQGVPRKQALEFAGQLPLYWGDQIIVAGPPYVGAILLFLFVLGLFWIKSKHKWWLLFGFLLSLVLSWGKHFPALTNFLIDYFPFYNKFRAVSSAQVVLELCVPVMGVLALTELWKDGASLKKMQQTLKWTVLGFLIFGAGIWVLKSTCSFESFRDVGMQQSFGDALVSAIQKDREHALLNDMLRSLLFIILAAIPIWLFSMNRIKKNLLAVVLGALILFDLVGVNLRYIDETDFIGQRRIDTPFAASQLDKALLEDKSNYRVFDVSEGLNGSRTSYFHKSIGGYHAAKPAGIQDLVEHHVYKNNTQVLNMLNVKYVLQQNEEGQQVPAVNPDHNGNAWFVSKLNAVASADEEMKALADINTKTTAIVNTSEYPRLTKLSYELDSLAAINLVDYNPHKLTYSTKNSAEGFAVFSEMHYPKGWQVSIDGKEATQFRVNYALRGMRIPEGSHEVVFNFQPEVVEKGSKISLFGSVLLGLIFLGGIGYQLRARKTKESDQ